MYCKKVHQEAAQCKFWDDDMNRLLKTIMRCYLYNDASVCVCVCARQIKG